MGPRFVAVWSNEILFFRKGISSTDLDLSVSRKTTGVAVTLIDIGVSSIIRTIVKLIVEYTINSLKFPLISNLI